MKPQNFYACLDDFFISAENILIYCEEIKRLEEDLIDYFIKEETTEKQFNAKMKILGAKNKKELASKKNKEIVERRKMIDNVSKFIDFMKKEETKHYKTMRTEKFCKWLDDESTLNESFFEKIEFIPAYIQKHSGVLVLDLMKTFKQIIQMIESDIENVIGISLPKNMQNIRLISIINFAEHNGIILTKSQKCYLSSLVIGYKDFVDIIEIIINEIKGLEAPVKI